MVITVLNAFGGAWWAALALIVVLYAWGMAYCRRRRREGLD